MFKTAKSIEIATDKIYQHLNLNPKGRLIYVGAGTSGRIGVQDGVELLPTFSWPKSQLDYIIAGEAALLNSIENAEDDILEPTKIVLTKSINSDDVIIGLAASGNTHLLVRFLRR